jgi:hypothetical protein
MPEITPEFLKSQGFSPTLPERFWAKVQKTENCWLWTAFKNKKGYGSLGCSSRNTKTGSESRVIRAHVLSWIFHNLKPVPEGLWVLHHCDNRACVRPDHLWVGTHADNMRDMKEKGRGRSGGCAGETHGASKITEGDVRAIRKLRKQGLYFYEIAMIYPLCKQTIWDICTRKTWAHVD